MRSVPEVVFVVLVLKRAISPTSSIQIKLRPPDSRICMAEHRAIGEHLCSYSSIIFIQAYIRVQPSFRWPTFSDYLYVVICTVLLIVKKKAYRLVDRSPLSMLSCMTDKKA